MKNGLIKQLKLKLTPALSATISNHICIRPIWVWLTLVLLTLFSAALAEGTLIDIAVNIAIFNGAVDNNTLPIEGNQFVHINQNSLLLVLGIVLVKGSLIIDYFMGLKHTQGWAKRIMKGYLIFVTLLIGSCLIYY